jgi:voltage-gated potassium channel
MRFRGALDRGNVTEALSAAAELDFVSLAEALELTLLVADDGDLEKHNRAALRWHVRFVEETKSVDIRESQAVLALLTAIPANALAAAALAALLSRSVRASGLSAFVRADCRGSYPLVSRRRVKGRASPASLFSGGSTPRVANRAGMWKQDESGRVHTPLEPVVLGATLALIPVLIIEADTTSQTWRDVATLANWVIWAIFASELAAVLVYAPRKRAALRAHWLDVAIVVLTIPLLGKVLAWLRLARLLRLARFVVIVARALQAERRLTSGDSLRVAAILTVTAIVVAGAAESAVSAGEFPRLWDGVWWAVVTVTTVGYGDLYPETVQGRLIGMVLMFVGIGFLSLLTAAVASRFVKQERGDEHEELMETLRRIEADVGDLKSRTR